MLRYAGVFFAIAAAAAIAGFSGLAGGATEFARILCYVFALVAAVILILGLLKL